MAGVQEYEAPRVEIMGEVVDLTQEPAMADGSKPNP